MSAVSRFAFALAIAALASACAERERPIVLLFGDSIFTEARSEGSDVASLLASLRPELTIVDASRSGRDTENARFELADAIGRERPDAVVILLGTNDPSKLGERDPLATARRLVVLAEIAERSGARAIVATLAPAPSRRGIDFDHQPFTREVGHWLLRMQAPGPGYRVVDVRDAFTTNGWSSCSTDGIHPDGIACRAAIAETLAAALP